jgi:phage repressor protein C with HTH and peptisase S24 domain
MVALMFTAGMTEETDIPTKLRALRESVGLSIRQMADELGMTSGSSYSHYELRYKRKHLPLDLTEQLADVIERHGGSRADALELAGINPQLSVGPSIREVDLVNVYDVAASAGHGSLIDSETVVERLAFPAGYLRKLSSAGPRDLAIIGVKGDSMSPTLADDDVVMVDMTKRDLSFDGLFVLRDGGASLLVKRIGRGPRRGLVILISDNRTYPPMERAIEDIEVVGKVVWMGVKV